MEINISKEWFKAHADKEGDSEVGAGIPPWVKRSSCCNAPMIVAGGREGTNWHECTACKKACDEMPPDDQAL
jgi:hypothetical protein